MASSVALAGALVFDERLRSVALANHSRTLDRLAAGADVLGTAGHIVPALAATYVGARTVAELAERATVGIQTTAGFTEGTPHGL